MTLFLQWSSVTYFPFPYMASSKWDIIGCGFITRCGLGRVGL